MRATTCRQGPAAILLSSLLAATGASCDSPGCAGSSGPGAGSSGAAAPTRYDAAMSMQRSIADLRAHDGEVIQVAGSLVLSERGKPLWTLRLDDGEVVVGDLAAGSGISWEGLAPFRGRRIAVTARVFFEAIPERYRIFARIGAPYLVDVSSIRTLE